MKVVHHSVEVDTPLTLGHPIVGVFVNSCEFVIASGDAGLTPSNGCKRPIIMCYPATLLLEIGHPSPLPSSIVDMQLKCMRRE